MSYFCRYLIAELINKPTKLYAYVCVSGCGGCMGMCRGGGGVAEWERVSGCILWL